MDEHKWYKLKSEAFGHAYCYIIKAEDDSPLVVHETPIGLELSVGKNEQVYYALWNSADSELMMEREGAPITKADLAVVRDYVDYFLSLGKIEPKYNLSLIAMHASLEILLQALN